VGGDDRPRIHDIADLLIGQIAGARKVLIPDAGHHPNMEYPAVFNEVVLAFLRSITGG
jgi:pimeloyl-ACP methyl ester carboxylesterase